MMKKMSLLIVGAIVLATASGCAGIGVREGYGYVAPSVIYSGGIQGGSTEPVLEVLKRPYTHLGRVSGEASQTNILMLVTAGDASIEKAQSEALSKVKGADALINRNIDVKQMSILCLFTVATLRVSGDAIKYTDSL